jgi:hypothetical protein
MEDGAKRFTRWAKRGVWERVFHGLIDDPKNEHVMLNATLSGPTSMRPPARAAPKGGCRERGSGAFPRWIDGLVLNDPRRYACNTNIAISFI